MANDPQYIVKRKKLSKQGKMLKTAPLEDVGVTDNRVDAQTFVKVENAKPTRKFQYIVKRVPQLRLKRKSAAAPTVTPVIESPEPTI